MVLPVPGPEVGIFTPVFYKDAGDKMFVRSIHPYFLFLNDLPNRPQNACCEPFLPHAADRVLIEDLCEHLRGPFAIIQNLLTGNDNPDGSERCRQKDGEDGDGQD